MVEENIDPEVPRWPLDYDDFVTKISSKCPNRYVIKGDAGTGKTTLCAKILLDWIKGRKNFHKVTLVIYVPLEKTHGESLGEVAKGYLSENNPVQVNQLNGYIKSNQNKILVIYDGLEELNEDSLDFICSDEDSSSLTQPRALSSPGNDSPESDVNITNDLQPSPIIKSHQLKSCPVVITSQAWKAEDLKYVPKLRDNISFIRLQGFVKESFLSYIEKYFKMDEFKGNQLIQIAEESEAVSKHTGSGAYVPRMAHGRIGHHDVDTTYPLFAAMLCRIWNNQEHEIPEMIRRMLTLSEIVKEMVLALLEHYTSKRLKTHGQDQSFDDCLKKVNDSLMSMGHIALQSLPDEGTDEKDIFSLPEAKEIALKTGILRHYYEERGYPRQQQSTFDFDSPFGDFIGGMYLASLFEADNNEYTRYMDNIFQKIGWYRHLLYFTASQNKDAGMDIIARMCQNGVENISLSGDGKLIDLAEMPTLKEDGTFEIDTAAAEREELMQLSRDPLRLTRREKKMDFIVDVAYECHDPTSARIVEIGILNEETTLTIDQRRREHTFAAYLFVLSYLVSIFIILQR